MRQLFSSICLMLILLNVMGYYGVLVGLQHGHGKSMIRQFDQNLYDAKAAIHLKVPVKTQGRQSEHFERIDGEFQHKDQLYRLIKQRIYLDTFHVVYIKDIEGTAIHLALKNYVKSFGDQPDSEGSNGYILPLFMKEYLTKGFNIVSETFGWHQTRRLRTNHISFISAYSPSIVHPPERIG